MNSADHHPDTRTVRAAVASRARCRFSTGAVLLGLLTFALLALLALSAPAGAAADVSFCPSGSGAGQCNGPAGVAVDPISGRIYVADRLNNRIDAFAEDGDFLFAFGWGVADGLTSAAQKCTASCHRGLAGAGTAQFDRPRWVAVDGAGDLYVATPGFRVQKFDEEGAFLRMWGWDVVASGPDNDTTPPVNQFETCAPAVGDTCKAGVQGEGEGQFAGQISPIAIGPGGVVHVGDSEAVNPRLERFEASGGFLGQCSLPVGVLGGGMAVDPAGNIYSIVGGGGGIFKFHSDCSEYGSPYPLDPLEVEGLQTNAMAVDASGDVYAEQRELREGSVGELQEVTQYNPAGTILARFGYGRFDVNATGLAVHPNASGESVLLSQASGAGNGLSYLTPPAQPGPIAATPTVEAVAVGSAKATVRAEVNPEGAATEYHFEYVKEATCDADEEALGSGHCFDHATSTSEEELASGAEDFRLHLAEVQIGCPHPATEASEPSKGCLTPGTRYRFRVVAHNSDGPGEGAAEGSLETHTLEIEASWATDVGTDSATLHVTVNPRGVPAVAHFEYVTEATCRADEETAVAEPGAHCFDRAVQTPELDLGSGEEDVTRAAILHSLPAGDTFRYRAVATNPLLEGPLRGEVHAFATKAPLGPGEGCPNNSFRLGPAAYLPDCRAYELVSPLDKNNGDVAPLLALATNGLTVPAGLEQSSLSGERLAYSSATAFADAPSSPWTSQYIAQRIPGSEWQTHAISPKRGRLAHEEIFGGNIRQFDTEFKVFSPELCEAWLETRNGEILAPGAVPGSPDVYRRDDRLCTPSGEDGYEALTTIAPTDGKLGLFAMELAGVSADGSTALYATDDSLAGTGAPLALQGAYQLYVRGEGKTRFACVLPGGAKVSCLAGTTLAANIRNYWASLAGAVSADGHRVFWSTPALDGGAIYVRENPLATGTECTSPTAPCTIPVSAPGEALAGTSSSRFLAASPDGSRVIYTTKGGGKSDLYEFDTNTEATHKIAGEAAGILGASTDLSLVYFLSEEALATGAHEGDTNLYVYRYAEGGSYRFIASLAAADALNQEKAGSLPSPIALVPVAHSARVSPDGSHLAFDSVGQPTGYDNTDAASGEADAEAYLYDADANGGEGKLVCASCNPTGVRPVGRQVVDAGGAPWVAARIPGWENSFYPSRVLSEDGERLFFTSTDALVARDSNGAQDVYQWEAPGKGDCTLSSPSYSGPNGGCLSLISSGTSPHDSEFRDASPSGDDVFFATLSSLLPQDYGLIDIYDARVEGGLPIPEPASRSCEGEACQSPPPAPNDPTPASSAFEGAGNVRQGSKGKRCPKGRRKIRKHGKVRCAKDRLPAESHHRAHRGHSRTRRTNLDRRTAR